MKMKNFKLVLLFGSLLAVLAVLLQFFEYKYFIGRLDTSVYTSVVATVFTVVGVWVGMNILKSEKEVPTPAPIIVNNIVAPTNEINEENLKNLNLNDR